MKKKKMNLSQIDNELFSETDIDFIDEKIELNMPILIGYEKYLEIDRKLAKLNTALVSSLNEKQIKLFREYQMVSLDSISYQNCLAYYIGAKSKIETEKLK